MTTATATVSHYIVREHIDATPVRIETYRVNSMEQALELRGLYDPQVDGVIAQAFAVFTDGTQQELR